MRHVIRFFIAFSILTFLLLAICESPKNLLQAAGSNNSETATEVTQQEFSEQEGYPVIVKPTGILPSEVPEIPKELFKLTVKGSIHIVSFNLDALREGGEKSRRIKVWAGKDIGYIVAERVRVTKSITTNISWSGKLIDREGRVGLTFSENDIVYGYIIIGLRSFSIMPLKDSEHHVIYESDPEAGPREICLAGKHQPISSIDYPLVSKEEIIKDKKMNLEIETDISVLVLFSPEMALRKTDMKFFIDSLISYANDAFSFSGVPITLTLAGSILIASSGGLVSAAATTHHEDTNQEKDYPIIIHPTGVLPSSLPKVALALTKEIIAIEGSVYIVSLNLKPLRKESIQNQRVELWLGEELGYIIFDRIKLTKYEKITTWIGKSIDREMSAVLTLNKNILYGQIHSATRSFGIFPVEDSAFHVIYEGDRSRWPPFGDDAIIIKKNDPPHSEIQLFPF